VLTANPSTSIQRFKLPFGFGLGDCAGDGLPSEGDADGEGVCDEAATESNALVMKTKQLRVTILCTSRTTLEFKHAIYPIDRTFG
jgi:hypothetical protein